MSKQDIAQELNNKIINDLQKYFDIPNLMDMTITEKITISLQANIRPSIKIVNIPKEI